MTKEEVLKRLYSAKSADRLKATKEIAKYKLADFAELLFSAFIKEKNDKRTWETQYQMILTLGLLNYKSALSEIEDIVQVNKTHDMITYAAGQTYVRLKRETICDAKPVIKLLQF